MARSVASLTVVADSAKRAAAWPTPACSVAVKLPPSIWALFCVSIACTKLDDAEAVAEASTSTIGIVGSLASTAVAALVPEAVAVTSRRPPPASIASALPEGLVSVTVSWRSSVPAAVSTASGPSPSIVVTSWPEPCTSTWAGMLSGVVPRSYTPGSIQTRYGVVTLALTAASAAASSAPSALGPTPLGLTTMVRTNDAALEPFAPGAPGAPAGPVVPGRPFRPRGPRAPRGPRGPTRVIARCLVVCDCTVVASAGPATTAIVTSTASP